MKSFIILTLIGLIPMTLNSQNYLFDSKSSGFHIAGQLGASAGSTLLGIRPGYTFNGILTLGLVVGSENISDLDLNLIIVLITERQMFIMSANNKSLYLVRNRAHMFKKLL